MDRIRIEKPDSKKLEELGVDSWPIWEKEASRFDWSYDEQETCYILEGKAKVEPEGGEPVEFGAGDLVTFPKGMNCVWEISNPIRKHYKFGE
ncbi:MAG: cupin domain-containing protein [Candidatus Omnitrophota bacterium]